MLKHCLSASVICVAQLVCTDAQAISVFTVRYGVYPSFALRSSDTDSGS